METRVGCNDLETANQVINNLMGEVERLLANQVVDGAGEDFSDAVSVSVELKRVRRYLNEECPDDEVRRTVNRMLDRVDVALLNCCHEHDKRVAAQGAIMADTARRNVRLEQENKNLRMVLQPILECGKTECFNGTTRWDEMPNAEWAVRDAQELYEKTRKDGCDDGTER